MADPVYQYVTPQGTIVPDTSSILGVTQAEYKAAFRQDLVVTPSTPQGVLIVAETTSRVAVVNNNAAEGNQINPNIAGGINLDSVMALSGQQRTAATNSIIPSVALTGVAGTPIPAGTQASTAAGIIFASQSTVVLADDGTATVDFAAIDTGPIQCPENALTQVVTNIDGWETVTNPNAAVPGMLTMSDMRARAFRNNTIGFQGVAINVCITSALYNVANVASLTYRENFTKADATIDGIFLLANSVWACVAGGADADIAAALLENKSSGSNWNGGVTVNLVEPTSGQTYPVKFDRPTAVPVLIRVTTTNGNANDIRQAVLDYIAGDIEGMPGFVTGADVEPFVISGAVITEYPTVNVTKVEVTLASSVSYSTDPIAIALNQIATAVSSSITVISS